MEYGIYLEPAASRQKAKDTMSNANTATEKTITIRANADVDDCLTEAAERYIASHPELEGWDLDPRWGDESRETVALTVPC